MTTDSAHVPQPIRLSRSPHPYFRHRPGPVPSSSSSYEYLTTQARSDEEQFAQNSASASATYFDADNRKRRKTSLTPSDSGTEADDESGAFLKGLPAPPANFRKGLKAGKSLGTQSPLLTPSCIDDECQRRASETQFRYSSTQQGQSSVNEESVRYRDKVLRRRRAELLRRATEILLLLCLSNADALQDRPFIRVPAAFDPATLLYPVLLPVFTVVSQSTCSQISLTINLALAISSIPRSIVPLQDSFSGHTSIQWLLSVLPVSILEQQDTSLLRETSPRLQAAESLVLLFPLHQYLLSTLGFLTANSLLPSELQLASVSMINVLVLGESPQALILLALLWIGGLLTFISCGHVLRWAVAIARVPSWRFRRQHYPSRGHHTKLPGISHIVYRLLGKMSTLTKGYKRSDEGNFTITALDKKPQGTDQGLSFSSTPRDSALDRLKLKPPALGFNSKIQQAPTSDVITGPVVSQKRKQRSNTFPSYVGFPPSSQAPGQADKSREPLFLLDKPRVLQSLTKAQATFVKWLYALYTYAMILTIIGGPVRIFIGRLALHDQEPVGWALGYLFGDNPTFRRLTNQWALENWIGLPRHWDNPPNGQRCWAEYLRWERLGAANTRLLVCIHCLNAITVGLVILLRLRHSVEVDTRRKVFHGMMVVMFLPVVFIDPTFASLALILVLSIFFLLDLFRASQLPPLSRPLTYFLAPYVDGRDHRGPVIVSHIFLLIGCAIPLWLSLASVDRTGERPWEGWDVSSRDLSMVSGVVCVGMGDAAASLVGRRFGRHRWCWSGGKSLEGSLAFATAVVFGLFLGRFWLLHGGWVGDSGDPWMLFLGKAIAAAVGASLTEAVLTGGNDNVIVPVVLWLLVRGLEL
ncbi:MAG: hypothetical protein Q9167_006862 [Letrouitia subvulpina]